MLLMTWLGTHYFYIAFIPVLYWSISKRWGVLAALALSTSTYLGELIKWSLKLPRPTSPPVQILSSRTLARLCQHACSAGGGGLGHIGLLHPALVVHAPGSVHDCRHQPFAALSGRALSRRCSGRLAGRVARGWIRAQGGAMVGAAAAEMDGDAAGGGHAAPGWSASGYLSE